MRALVLFIVYYSLAGYSLLSPVVGVLFFVHIMIFRPENLVWESPMFGRLHLITAVCTAIGCLSHRDARWPRANHPRRNLMLFAIFIGWLWCVSLTAAVSSGTSADRAIEFTKIFLFCVLFTVVVTSPSRIRLYVLVASGSFGLLGLWGVLQGMAGNPRLDTLWVGGSNYLAAGLALMIPFALTAALDPGFSRARRVGLALSTLAMTLCLFYTASRGGLFALVVGLLSLVVLAQKKGRLIVGLLAMTLIVYPMVPSDQAKRISPLIQDDDTLDLSAESRPVLWQLAFRMWQDHPVFGVGLGNFGLAIDAYSNKAADIVKSQEMAELIFGRGRQPHGMYTGMLAETGLIGVGLLALLLWRNALCRMAPATGDLVLVGRGAQAGILGFAVGAAFGDYQYIDVLYWQLFIVGTIVAVGDPANGAGRDTSDKAVSTTPA